MRKSFQVIFVWMLYNKNWQSYSNPRQEKRECSREAKMGTAHCTWTRCMRSLKWPYKKTVTATVTKLCQLVLWLFIIIIIYYHYLSLFIIIIIYYHYYLLSLLFIIVIIYYHYYLIIIIIIIIIVSFWQTTPRPFRSCLFAKNEGTIQYGYRKKGTHARVFLETLAHGNRKNELRERIDEDGKKKSGSVKKSKGRNPDGLLGGWVLFLKEPTAALRWDPELQPQLLAWS